ncbi:hypothetical protein [Kamptonema formosum]|uniref:hypothetical protein n=1 Tax=Kamptonema formosum TaxID=331992 RepID=UPI000344D65F|nr:hypothetical protein [Oscillatoria sp. PCC 10802]
MIPVKAAAIAEGPATATAPAIATAKRKDNIKKKAPNITRATTKADFPERVKMTANAKTTVAMPAETSDPFTVRSLTFEVCL